MTVTPEMVPWLMKGCWHRYEHMMVPADMRGNEQLIRDMVSAGYAKRIGLILYVTEKGRKAVNGPSENEAYARRVAEHNAAYGITKPNPFPRKHQKLSAHLRCLPVYVHSEAAGSIVLSLDGDEAKKRRVGKNPITFDPRTRQPFIAITIPAWLSKATRLHSPGRSALTTAREWTPEDHLAWAWANAVASHIRSGRPAPSQQEFNAMMEFAE